MTGQRIKVSKAEKLTQTHGTKTNSVQDATAHFDCRTCNRPDRAGFVYKDGLIITHRHHDRKTHESVPRVDVVLQRLFSIFDAPRLEWVIKEASKELEKRSGRIDSRAARAR